MERKRFGRAFKKKERVGEGPASGDQIGVFGREGSGSPLEDQALMRESFLVAAEEAEGVAEFVTGPVEVRVVGSKGAASRFEDLES